MKFIVNSSVLSRHLSIIDGVVVSKPIIPILNNFLLDIKDGELVLSSTDLETTMTTAIKVDAKEDVAIAIPTKAPIELLKQLSDQPLAITVNTEKNFVEIKYATGRLKLTAQNAEEFPKTPEVEDAKSFQIPAKVLQRAIAKTVFATSTDELRLNLTGVYVQLFEKNVVFVATDANRLVSYTRSDVAPGVEDAFILPRKALNLLKNALPNDDTAVSISFNRSNAFFAFNDIKLVCRLIDEKYPEYKAVIPADNNNRLLIERSEFISAIKRVSITTNKTTHQIRVRLAGNEVTVSAEDLDFENESQEKLTCSYEGDDLEIGFNSKYLSELLVAMDAPNIRMELSQPNRAGIILPENQEAGEDMLMLVMPMMLNSY